jgi:hypothetical protein
MKLRRFVLVAAAVLGGLLSLLWWRWGRLAGLDDETRASRILEARGVLCTPKIVQRVDEGVFYVVCANGKYELVSQMPCSESFACEMLGVDAACWDVTSYSRSI